MRTALLSVGFALTGVVTTMLGPLLPTLIHAWQIDDARAGSLFTAQFVGALVGLALTNALVRRVGSSRLLVAGFAIVAAGVAGLAAGSWRTGMASVFVYGAGLSFAIPTINLHVSAAYPERRAAALNVMNFVWGVGALASPFVVRGLVGYGLPVVVAAVAGSALVVGAALVPGASSPLAEEGDRRRATTAGAWRDPALVAACAIAFLYVGSENAIAGWVAVFVERIGGPAFAGTVALALFWGALLAARAAAPIALAWLAPRRLVLMALVVSIVGAALIPAAPNWGTVAAATAIAGAGFATIYPTLLALFTEHFGERGDRLITLVFASSTLGGAALPWCVGAVSARTGALRVGLLVPAAACAIMLALQSVPIGERR